VDREAEYQAHVSSTLAAAAAIAVAVVDGEKQDEYVESNAESDRLDEYDDVAVALRAGIELQRTDPDCSRH
jgi:hypothetical protein